MALRVASGPVTQSHALEWTLSEGFLDDARFVFRCAWCRRRYYDVSVTPDYPVYRLVAMMQSQGDRIREELRDEVCDRGGGTDGASA